MRRLVQRAYVTFTLREKIVDMTLPKRKMPRSSQQISRWLSNIIAMPVSFFGLASRLT
jgi:hypothetical protein